eukprot:TRINITY_DN2445_c0_g8_i1.p1 TRINITY_DN2445_c0_g8~~TRINITY_DN2445_c0_g8_i1.p1  ORF type:complete len:256 (+),score=112.16 TRINITY_DN2445_c0_g8_i1:59-826(+)
MSKYDTDVTRWSSEGRLYQIDYAMEAVKKGNATVGLKSNTHVVLVALRRSPQAELASYQEKIFKLDPKMGMAIAGLTSDGRELAGFIRTECMNHRYVFDEMQPVSRLADLVGDRHQSNTMKPGRRPYGVGCLLAGYDGKTNLYQTCPSGNYYDYKAFAIGNRSQSARTYFESRFTTFADMPLDDLVHHGLRALATTCGDGVELKPENTAIAIVGNDRDFQMSGEEETKKWLDSFKVEDPAAAGPTDEGEEAMDMN